MPNVSFGGNKVQKICFQLHLYWTCTLVLCGRILLAQSTTQVKLRAQKIGRDEVNCPPLDKILLYWLTFWKIFGGNLSGNIFFFVFKFLNSFLVSSTLAGLTLYCFIGENLFLRYNYEGDLYTFRSFYVQLYFIMAPHIHCFVGVIFCRV